jgi:hypothetical protein
VVPPMGKSTGAASRPRRERKVAMARRTSTNKVTSAKVASKASKALADGRSSKRTKSIAASALAQAKSKKK